MKNKKSKLFVLALCLILPVSLFFSGCAGGQALSKAEINNLFKESANSFFANHRDTESYSAITYHWNEVETIKNNEVLEYKEQADDEDYVTGTFEQKTVITTETTLAIKKEGEHLVAELNIVNTTVETGNDVDGISKTIEPYDDTTVETSKYRMFHYTENAEQKNILVYNYNKTINGEPANNGQIKSYAEKIDDFTDDYSMGKYDTFVNESLIQITNEKIANYFFEYAESILFYDSMLDTEKSGNQVKIAIGYELVSVDDENWGVVDINAHMSSSFKGGKIWKAECGLTHTFETGSMERTMTFDYTNEATINMEVPEDLATYTNRDEIWANGSNPDGSLRSALNNLPSLAIF